MRTLIVALAIILTVATVSEAQTYTAPRAPDGTPDLNGIWQAINTANWNVETHSASAGPMWELGAAYAVPGGFGVVDGGTIPYRPEALEQRNENFENRMTLDPEMKCYLPGVPRATYQPFPFQILQSQQHIMIVHEFAGAVRTIYMDNQPAPAPSWMGWSNGSWEGETLVVDTTDFNGNTWFDRAGNFHTDTLHVIERFTARSPETITYEVTIEDPAVFTRPWTMTMPLYRRAEPNLQLTEFRCVEYSEELLYGHLRKPGTPTPAR